MRHLWWMTTLLALAPFLAACGHDCVGVCEEAQDGNCTYISSPCDQVCGAVETIGPCEDDLDAYLGCLGGPGDVCDSQCGSKEINLYACISAFCESNPSDGACADLADLL